MKKYLTTGLLIIGMIATNGCLSTTEDGEQAISSVEEMSELEYTRFSQYLYLGTKIGAVRLLDSGELDAATLEVIAGILEGLADEPLLDFGSGFIVDAITEQTDLTNDELMLILLIVEQELLARGGATYLDPETGELRLTERTEELMDRVASALRSAVNGMTEEEVAEHDAFQEERK